MITLLPSQGDFCATAFFSFYKSMFSPLVERNGCVRSEKCMRKVFATIYIRAKR